MIKSSVWTNRKKIMIELILQTVAANQLPVTGELFFTLAFRTESELVAICHELHIIVPKRENHETENSQ